MCCPERVALKRAFAVRHWQLSEDHHVGRPDRVGPFSYGSGDSRALLLFLAPVPIMKMLFGQCLPMRSAFSSLATGGCWLA